MTNINLQSQLEADLTSGVLRFNDPEKLTMLVRMARGIAYNCDDYRYFPTDRCSPQTKLLISIADIVLDGD